MSKPEPDHAASRDRPPPRHDAIKTETVRMTHRISAAKIAQLEVLFRAGCSIERASKEVGCDRTTARRYFPDDLTIRRGPGPRAPGTEAVNHLTGRGGVGLVMFHLARNKIEFLLTPDRSPLGDLWVSIGTHKFGIEVKTCRTKLVWQIKKSQIEKVDFYALVSMEEGCCFVLTSVEMAFLIRDKRPIYGDVFLVARNQVPDEALNAWGRIDGKSPGSQRSPALVVGRRPPSGSTSYTHAKAVRKTLKDGTVKTYLYERGAIITKPRRKPLANGQTFEWDA